LGQHRSTQRKIPTTPDDEVALTADIIALARQYGRYGYRRITALLRRAGWTVNKKRVERIWRCEGLKVPAKQPKRGRLWLNDGSCIRLRPERPNHVWSYDFVADRTHDGKAFRMLCIIDEFSRESLAIRVARKLKATDVIEALCELFVSRGIPAHIVQTTDLSSLPKHSGIGSPLLEPRPPTSNRAARGRMATARASTASCAMNC
jgi:transposase InsO family protein